MKKSLAIAVLAVFSGTVYAGSAVEQAGIKGMDLKLPAPTAVEASQSGSKASPAWVRLVDCKDVHGNQLEIDIDVVGGSNLQMVLRPAPAGSPSVIAYLVERALVYSQAVYNEIVVPVSRGHLVDFQSSDPYLTHLVKLDNPMANHMNPDTGAWLEVRQGGKHNANWYFSACKKFY